MAEQNWHRIDKAPKGIGPLLCSADAANGPFYVAIQNDDGRWLAGDAFASPTHYCGIPTFDCEETAGLEPTP